MSASVTVIAREPLVNGTVRYRLSNGWFIDRASRVSTRHMGYLYTVWAPGQGEGGIAKFLFGADTKAAALELVNR